MECDAAFDAAVHLGADAPLSGDDLGQPSSSGIGCCPQALGERRMCADTPKPSGRADGLLPEGVERAFVRVVTADLLDQAVTHLHKLATGDIEVAAAMLRRRVLDSDDILLANGDVQ